MRPSQGIETKNFAAKSLFIDHAIDEDIWNWKTKQRKCVLKTIHDISCDETKQKKQDHMFNKLPILEIAT